MEVDMESISSSIGVSIPVLRFLICFAATIPVGFISRLVTGTQAKHLYNGMSGTILSYLSFGFSSNLHFVVIMALGYGSMTLIRPYSGFFTFFAAFAYLIGCHVYYMSGAAWKEGGMDSTDVYERLMQKGKKPGFLQLLATQTTSAIWHGIYPGYFIFFVQSAFMIAGSRVIYRWQRSVSQQNPLGGRIMAFINFAYTVVVLNYSCVGFIVLSLEEALASYQSVFFIGTIIPVMVILLGFIFKPARPQKPKAQKCE